MSKTISTRALILTGVFVASLGIGYFSMNLIGQAGRKSAGEIVKTTEAEEKKKPNLRDNTPADTLNSTMPQDDNSALESSNENNSPESSSESVLSQNTPSTQTIELHATKPSRSGDGYNFRASCQGVADGESVHYELWGNRKMQSSTDGLFIGVPGTVGGSYKLCLVGAGNKNLATIRVSGFASLETEHTQGTQEPAQKMLITQSEFQTKMLNPNDNTLKMARRATDKKSPLAHNFTLNVIDMSPSENKRPTDIEGVREKIHFGIWKSATVTELVYNESTGQVVQATITPNY